MQTVDSGKVHFGSHLKNKLESDAKYSARKIYLEFAMDTVRTGKHTQVLEKGENRDYYGKMYYENIGFKKRRGVFVIVSSKDAEVFNLFPTNERYLINKRIGAKQKSEAD